MKPLTIEELKALEVGDWVWVEILSKDIIGSRGYYQITDGKYLTTIYLFGHHTQGFEYRTYGTKWLAYKNKEQAEAKGEIVELPCIAMVEQGIVDGVFKPTKEAQQFNGRYAVVYVDKSKYSKPLIDICWSKRSKYDYAQTEARLQELRGEK